MRKLVTIRIVDEIQPIENADKIEYARFGGWWTVTKKDEFKVGDLAVYFEIDSLLPLKPQFEFVARGKPPCKCVLDNKEIIGHRLKTVTLRNKLSQGLALPLSSFPELEGVKEGDDVSEALGVVKYMRPIPPHLLGEMRGDIPGYIHKTDEERIQDLIADLDKYRGKNFYITEKVDGESMTVFRHAEESGVCSHRLWLNESGNSTFCKIAKKYDLINKIPDGYAIQGELAGEGIEDNTLKLNGHDFFLFYVYNIKSGRFMSLDNMLEFARYLGIRTVPIVDDQFTLNHSCEELLQMANRKSLVNPYCDAEGLVFRLKDEGTGPKISFKVLCNKYLLDHGK